MHASRFQARVDECRALAIDENSYPMFLAEYLGSPISSLSKEFGHYLVESRHPEMFHHLERIPGNSEPVTLAFRILSLCASPQGHPWKWNADWRDAATRTTNTLAEECSQAVLVEFISIVHMLLLRGDHRNISELAAVAACKRIDLQKKIAEGSTEKTRCDSLLTLLMFDDILSAMSNSMLCKH